MCVCIRQLLIDSFNLTLVYLSANCDASRRRHAWSSEICSINDITWFSSYHTRGLFTAAACSRGCQDKKVYIPAECWFLTADKRTSCVGVGAAAAVLVIARFPSVFWLACYFHSTSGFHFILQQWLQTFSILARRPVTFTWQICFLTTRQPDRGGNQNSHHSCKFAEIIPKNESCCGEDAFLCLITAARYWWVLRCAVCLNTWSDKLWKPNPPPSQNSAWAFNPRKQICICVPALVEWIIDYHCHTAYDASRDYSCCRLNKAAATADIIVLQRWH